MSLLSAYAKNEVVRAYRGALQADGHYSPSGTTATYMARVQQSIERVYSDTGEVLVYDYVMWFPVGVTLIIGDKLTFGGTAVEVIKRDTRADLTGKNNHQKVYVKITGV